MVGAGGHGRVVCEAVVAEGCYQLLGFVDDEFSAGTCQAHREILGGVDDLPRLSQVRQLTHCIVAVGDNSLRRKVIARIEKLVPQLSWGTVIHPGAELAVSATVGAGSVVLAGAIVCARARVGRHCIVNTGSQLDHDSQLGDYASLAPGVVTGGNVQIGEATAVGLGARIIHGITIGEESVVGAGAVVVGNVPASVVSFGVPSRVISARKPGEKYL